MPMHFDTAEYAARKTVITRAVQEAGRDAPLMFAPKNHSRIAAMASSA